MKDTMKEKVLQFVESQGSATFTEIQRFIVDTKFGAGTYGSRLVMDCVWDKYAKTYIRQEVKRNPYRGYYCSAFSQWRHSLKKGTWTPGYFLHGTNRLEKQENGKYITVRF